MTEDTLDDPLTDFGGQELTAPLTEAGNWGAATTVGLVRHKNEDAWGQSGGTLFVVADGMGGYSGGDIASRAAVSGLTLLAGREPVTDWMTAILALNHRVRAAGRERGHARAGTALAAFVLSGGIATICHVGDVRAYRLRHDQLHRLTDDHTVAGELGDRFDPAAAIGDRPVPPHALTRFLGGPDSRCEPAIATLVPQPGDRLLLLTDGVFRQIEPARLAGLAASPDPQVAAQSLVDAADAAGGNDNATALVVECRRRSSPPDPNT